MKLDFNIHYGCGCKKNQAQAQAQQAQVQAAQAPSKPTVQALTKPSGK